MNAGTPLGLVEYSGHVRFFTVQLAGVRYCDIAHIIRTRPSRKRQLIARAAAGTTDSVELAVMAKS